MNFNWRRPALDADNVCGRLWHPTSRFGVRLWGESPTNANYIANLLSRSSGWYGTYAAPRTHGVRAMKNF